MAALASLACSGGVRAVDRTEGEEAWATMLVYVAGDSRGIVSMSCWGPGGDAGVGVGVGGICDGFGAICDEVARLSLGMWVVRPCEKYLVVQVVVAVHARGGWLSSETARRDMSRSRLNETIKLV